MGSRYVDMVASGLLGAEVMGHHQSSVSRIQREVPKMSAIPWLIIRVTLMSLKIRTISSTAATSWLTYLFASCVMNHSLGAVHIELQKSLNIILQGKNMVRIF